MRIYLLIAAIAGGVTWLVTPLIRHVAIEIGAVGEVRARDVHTIPTPRMGGLGMLIGLPWLPYSPVGCLFSRDCSTAITRCG